MFINRLYLIYVPKVYKMNIIKMKQKSILKNKTYEEVYGKERAKQIIYKRSQTIKNLYQSGKLKQSPLQLRGLIKRNKEKKGKTYKEIYGQERAIIECNKRTHAKKTHRPKGYKLSKLHCKRLSESHKGIRPTKETRLNHSLLMIKYYKGHIHPMKDKHHTKASKLKMKLSRYKYLKEHPESIIALRNYRLSQIIPTKDSIPEKMIQKELKRNGIKFKKHIKLIGQPDLFIEPNICIFCDGDFWHGNPSIYKSTNLIGVGKDRMPAKQKWKYDNNINKQLKKQQYIVLRFWEKDIHKDINLIINKIKKVI